MSRLSVAIFYVAMIPDWQAQAAAQAPVASPRATLAGEVFELEATQGRPRRYLMIDQGPAGRAAGRRLGEVLVHSGRWVLTAGRRVRPPAESATIVGFDGTCEARLRRGLRVHGRLVIHGVRRVVRRRFLAFPIEGCGGGYGVIGSEVVVHRIEPSTLPQASAELARLVAPYESAIGGFEDTAPVRALVLPAFDLAIVCGKGRWIVHHGEVRQHGYGLVDAVGVTDDEVIFSLSAPSESWHATLGELLPWRPPGDCRPMVFAAHPPSALRADASGDSPEVGRLDNGTFLEIGTMRDGWYEVLEPTSGWISADFIDASCTQP